eukprot:GHVT01007240.1.p3 GENE.GHVT01007240.1~~GHVT01007240.1.p3  ORF type:complete len:100 (+),score=6.01 GHVT01007240.1:3447-3746(+)
MTKLTCRTALNPEEETGRAQSHHHRKMERRNRKSESNHEANEKHLSLPFLTRLTFISGCLLGSRAAASPLKHPTARPIPSYFLDRSYMHGVLAECLPAA